MLTYNSSFPVSRHELLGDYESDHIDISKESKLDKTKEMLTTFLKLTNRDIEKAYYKRERDEDEIKYSLMLSKKNFR